MRELDVNVSAFGTSESLKDNIRYALTLGLKELGLSPCKHDGTFVIVGSSPSLKDFTSHISKDQLAGKPICAINGAHDFLIQNRIIPELFLTTDPRPMPQNFKYRNPKTIYMIASRCHKETFESLRGLNVLLWHAWMDRPETDELLDGKRMAIGGGTTSGLRAINVAYVMGFRKFKLYGMDSCLDENKAKRVDGKPMNDETKTIDVIVGGKSFLCNMAMAQQAQDFQGVYAVMPDITIECFGDGLLSAIIKERKEKGLKT